MHMSSRWRLMKVHRNAVHADQECYPIFVVNSACRLRLGEIVACAFLPTPKRTLNNRQIAPNFPKPFAQANILFLAQAFGDPVSSSL